MRRITGETPEGKWGVENIAWDEIDHRLYGAMCKLKAYKDTGLSPDEVERLIEARGEDRKWS